MNSYRLKERLDAAEAFLEIAKYLDGQPPFRVNVDLSPSAIEDVKDRQRWWRGLTCHMLYSIVFEIAIKVIWELDNQKDCRNTHDIGNLYDQLSEASQQHIQSLYDQRLSALTALEGNNKEGVRVKVIDLTTFQSLRDALRANEDTMKNFKYEVKYKGKSSAIGNVIWNETTAWIIPPIYDCFPEALYRYTVDRLEQLNENTYR